MSITLDGTTGITTPDVETSDGAVYAKGNILGTVSQSGGVPTGAIIQRGSNANGEFVRYADGTQIANGEVLLTFPSGSAEADPFVVTFPAEFGMNPRPVIHLTLGRNSYGATTGKMLPFNGNLSATDFTIRAWNLEPHGSSQTRVFQWTAIGNWF